MKNLFIFLGIFIFSIVITKAQNPYSQFGCKAGVLQTEQEKSGEYDFVAIANDTNSEIQILHFNLVNMEYIAFNAKGEMIKSGKIVIEIPKRWMSIDPLSSEFPDKSPYNFVSNNPINRIDPNGLADFYNEGGELVKHTEDDDNSIFVTKSEIDENTDFKVLKGDKNNTILVAPYEERQAFDRFMRSEANRLRGTSDETGATFSKDGKFKEGGKDYVVRNAENRPQFDVRQMVIDHGGSEVMTDFHTHNKDGNPSTSSSLNEGSDLNGAHALNVEFQVTQHATFKLQGLTNLNAPMPTINFYNSSGVILKIKYDVFINLGK